MAIAMNALTEGNDAGGASSTSASITPTANALVLLAVHDFDINAFGIPAANTASGNGLTWVQVANVGVVGSWYDDHGLTVLRAMGASPSTGAITISGDSDVEHRLWSVVEFTGVDTSGTNGSGAVVQSATDSGTTSPQTATLASFGATANRGYMAGGGQSATVDIDNNYTEIHGQERSSGARRLETGWRDNDTAHLGCDVTSTSADGLCVISIEIKAAPATWDQDGFRFYEDDNTDVNSQTASAAEDTNITRAKEDPCQIRVQMDVTGTPGAVNFKLQHRKSAGTWGDTPVT